MEDEYTYLPPETSFNQEDDFTYLPPEAPASSGQISSVPFMTETGPITEQERQKVAPKRKGGISGTFDEAIERQGGFGLSPETFRALGGESNIPGLGVIQRGFANAANLGYKALQVGQAGLETAATGADDLSKALGVADLPRLLGIDQQILPGTAIMALLEASPTGGAQSGISTASFAARAAQLAARDRIAAEGNALFQQGATPAEMQEWASANKLKPFDDANLAEATARRNRGESVAPFGDAEAEALREQLKNEALDFVNKKAEEALPAIEQEAKNFVPAKEPTPEDLFPSEEALRKRDADLEAKLQKEAEEFQKDKAALSPSETPSTPAPVITDQHLNDAVDQVNSITRNWKNSPEFEVHADGSSLPDLDPDAIGAVTPEGKVVINMSNVHAEAEARGVTPQNIISAVTFHEGLGHSGLAARFGEDLDKVLDTLYNNSTFLRRAVNKRIAEFPDEYPDDFNPRARAAEEVLAEMSEQGQITSNIFQKIRNHVKSFGRRIGLKLDYSDAEIRTILSMAHDSVVNGKGINAAANGFRLMKRRRVVGQESEGVLQGPAASEEKVSPGTINAFRSNRPIDDILQEVAPEKTPESWDEWIEKANSIKMTTRMAEALSKGAEVPELKAAERFLVESGNRIFDLSKKASEGTITPHEQYLLGKEMERASRISKVVNDIVSNAGRILNSRKIEVGSDKALQTSLRNMMRNLTADDLNTPEKIQAVAQKLVKDTEQAKKVEKGLGILYNALNLPRSLMSSLDFSAPFRQGFLLTTKKSFYQALPKMFKASFSPEYFKGLNEEIAARPTYPLMKKAGLALTEVGNELSKREEAFMSEWAGKIPVLGGLVKGSERAYSGFLNRVRADVFDEMVNKMKDAGIDLSTDDKALKDIAKFVNTASGRGNLPGRLEPAAPALSGLFFSPRLMSSRVSTLNPAYYIGLNPVVRKEALKQLIATGALASTVLGVLAAGGANIELDPRSSDFGKARYGDTRYDLLGGFGQYITLGSRLATNQTKNIKGDVSELGKGFAKSTRFDVALKFLTNKESPIASFVTDWMKGKDAVGEDFNTTKAIVSRFVPMIASDLHDLIGKYGTVEGTAKALPAVFGAGVQDYSVAGSDIYGRDYSTTREPDAVTQAVDDAFDGEASTKIRDVPKSVQIDGEKIQLTDEQHTQWQKLTGQYFYNDLQEAINDPVWSTMTNEEKQEEIRLIRKDAKADALADLNIVGDDTNE